MSQQLRFDALKSKTPTSFHFEPDHAALKSLAHDLDISAVRKLRLEGTVAPSGKADWTLKAHLGATVVQPCRVTLEPVTTRIEEDLIRHYASDWQAPEEAEFEMPEDDESEPVPEVLDLAELAREALSLALPAYPRLPDAELKTHQFAKEGVEPLTDEAVKPFAGLADLKKKLESGE